MKVCLSNPVYPSLICVFEVASIVSLTLEAILYWLQVSKVEYASPTLKISLRRVCMYQKSLTEALGGGPCFR